MALSSSPVVDKRFVKQWVGDAAEELGPLPESASMFLARKRLEAAGSNPLAAAPKVGDWAGRVLQTKGVTYVSPNSKRWVPLPRPWPESEQDVFPPRRMNYHDWTVPRLWKGRYAYAPFVCVKTHLGEGFSAPLGEAMDLSSPHIEQDRDTRLWSLSRELQNKWIAVLEALEGVSTAFIKVTGDSTAMIRRPTELGFLGKYRDSTALMYHVNRSREWFMLPFAHLTYCFAKYDLLFDPSVEESEIWKSLLATGVNVFLLRSYLASTVLTISKSGDRVGCFLDVPTTSTPAKIAELADCANFLIYNNIPVWYIWDDNAKEVFKSRALFYLQPPGVIAEYASRPGLNILAPAVRPDLRAAARIQEDIDRVAGLDPADLDERPLGPFGEAKVEVLEGEDFFEFKRRMEDRCGDVVDGGDYALPLASTGGLSLNWEYWRWTSGEDGRYTVAERLGEDGLEWAKRYSPLQRWYCPITESLHLCEGLDKGEDWDPNLGYTVDESVVEPALGAGAGEMPGWMVASEREVSLQSGGRMVPKPSSVSLDMPGWLEDRVKSFWGLQRVTHFNTNLNVVLEWSTKEGRELLAAVGGPRDIPAGVPRDSEDYRVLFTLIKNISDLGEDGHSFLITAGGWDLAPVAPDIALRLRHYVHRVGVEAKYIVSFPGEGDELLAIVVFCVEAVLLAVRQQDFSYRGVAVALYRAGVRFNGCTRSRRDPERLPEARSQIVLPIIRGTDVDFKELWERYLWMRRSFLVGPRVRGALLAGSVASRVATDIVGDEALCERLVAVMPSPDAVRWGTNLVARDHGGFYLYDDCLSPAELNFLLGVMWNYAGGSNPRMWSWWPTWTLTAGPRAPLLTWFWSDQLEIQFQGRREDLLSDAWDERSRPKPMDKWIQTHRLSGLAGKFVAAYRRVAEQVVLEHCGSV